MCDKMRGKRTKPYQSIPDLTPEQAVEGFCKVCPDRYTGSDHCALPTKADKAYLFTGTTRHLFENILLRGLELVTREDHGAEEFSTPLEHADKVRQEIHQDVIECAAMRMLARLEHHQ